MSDSDRKTVEGWVRARTTPRRLHLRARIVLLTAQGVPPSQITQRLGTTRPTVALWRKRFQAGGLAAVQQDAPGRGRPRSIPTDTVQAIVRATTQTTPKGATHWSTRTMAEAFGVSNATVARIWQAHGLQPHRVRPFKVSRDKRFAEKLTDVVGLYLPPPDKALVLCVDEKSQIQALDRTQPGLPIKKGRCGTMTHDDTRNGTTTLFAALNVLEGTVLGACYPRHRNGEFRAFLQQLDRTTPAGLDLHLIVDNYWDAQTSQGAAVAGQASAFPSPLHPDQLVVVEPRRAVVPGAHHQTHSAGGLQERPRPHRRHRGVHPGAQHPPEAFGLDEVGGDHPGKGGAL